MQEIYDTISHRFSAVTVGTFDGVHRGHREVVKFMVAEGTRRGLRPVAITFEPHPLAVVAPERAPKLLELPSEREENLRSLGAEVMVLKFDRQLSQLTAAQWLERLATAYGTRMLVVGFDNTFGSDGMSMNISDYRKLGESYGIEIIEAPVVEGVSSTLIRHALGSGDVAAATGMLGRPYAVGGIVGHGRELGRQLGFPTANIKPDPSLLLPAPGVYAADALLPDGQCMRAVVNIGVSPTVRPGLPLSVEAHIIGFKGNLYESELRLNFLRRLRDERRFHDIRELKEKIDLDVKSAQNI